MRKRFWLVGGLVLAVVIAVILLFPLPPRGQENAATVVEVVNKVDAHPRPKDDWQPAAVGMGVFGGGQVRTGAVSAARLELLEGVVRLSAETVFTLEESVAHRGTLLTILFLQEGRLWANLTTDRPHEFTVQTGSAVAAVRDTHFSVRVADGETLLSVAEGAVELTAQEQTVIVAAEQQAIVEPGQPPSPPRPMSDEERALWATEGEMPEMAPPTLTPAPTETPVPRISCDVYGDLIGPAGDPASRGPQTVFDVVVQGGDAVRVVVELPGGEMVELSPYGDVYGGQRRFHMRIEGLPQAGGSYACTALDAGGTPVAGGMSSEVYVGGYEPGPPSNVEAEVVEGGLLVSWDAPPLLPGAFEPGASPPVGFYQISFSQEEGETVYGWNNVGYSLTETSHLIPFHRRDFGPGDRGEGLKEIPDGVYFLTVEAFSLAPAGTPGSTNECSAHDPAEDVHVVVESGQVRVEGR